MTKPNLLITTTMMILIIVLTMMTTSTSMMCINVMVYTMMMTAMMSVKLKLTPVPFITFLTMIGGLMVLFLYLAVALWMKKEVLTKGNTYMMMSMFLMPMKMMYQTNHYSMAMDNSMFEMNLNKITITLVILLTTMVVFTIEIHMKPNNPFRRKTKIW